MSRSSQVVNACRFVDGREMRWVKRSGRSVDCSIKCPPSTQFLMARKPSEGPPGTLGEASNGAILGRRRPSSCQAGTMDRCWCGGRGNSGPSIPNKRAVGREARAQDCLVQVPDLLVSRDFGILPTGHFPLTSEKGFTMLQIKVTAQPTVLAGGKVSHYCQRFRPISLFLEQFHTATLCCRFRWSGHG